MIRAICGKSCTPILAVYCALEPPDMYIVGREGEGSQPPKNCRLVLFPAGRSTVYDDLEYTANAFCMKQLKIILEHKPTADSTLDYNMHLCEMWLRSASEKFRTTTEVPG